jgi:drug/metabolite transporter (DMT)-like permease
LPAAESLLLAVGHRIAHSLHNATMALTKQTIGIAAAVVTVAIWSSFIVIARAMAHKTLLPFDIVFVRIVAAALVLVPWGWWWVRSEQAKNPQAPSCLGLSPLSPKLTAQVGITGGVAYACFAYSGFLYAPAAHASVLLPGFLPLWTALLAFFVLRTPVTRARGFGLAMILCGGLFVGGASLLRAFDGGDVWKGDVLFLCGSFFWSVYTIIARKNGLAAIPATIAVIIFAVFTYVPIYGALALAQWLPSRLAQAPWSEILFQALVQGIGSVIISGITFVRMVETFGPVRSTMITALVPGLSALGAVFFLGEPLYWNLIVGLIAVSLGIVFGVRSVTPAAAFVKK